MRYCRRNIINIQLVNHWAGSICINRFKDAFSFDHTVFNFRFFPKSITSIIICLIATVWITGCVKIRLLTYPAEFTYLEKTELQSAMAQMAKSVSRLNALATNSAGSVEEVQTEQHNRHEAILVELEEIETIALSLTANSSAKPDSELKFTGTNHLLIDEHIDEFLNQVDRAKRMAQLQPPDYYAMGQLTGNCMACHRLR